MAATAARKLFVNWYNKTLQVSDTNGGAFALPTFNKYETIPFEIVIVQPEGSQFQRFNRVDISNLSLSIAINDTYDDAAPLAYQPSFSKDEDTNTFSGELALNTAAMNSYIGGQSTAAAFFEIEIQEGTARSKIFVGSITLQNAVTQNAVTTPTPVDEYFTKAQTEQQFVKKVMPSSEQITITSPMNLYQRIIGVGDDGMPIDNILPT